LVCITNLIKFALQTSSIKQTKIMETNLQHPEQFDQSQSIQVIREMISVSQKKLKNDGILLIIWGWISFLTYLFEFLAQTIIITYQVTLVKRYLTVLLPVLGFIYTVVYLVRQNRKVTTYIGISLRYVWLYLLACMVLVNLIQNNVLHKITFEFQLPVFMVLVSFALVVTGGILRYKMIVAGGILFGLLAYISSFYSLQYQLLIEAIAWFVSFIIPGHILFAQRKS
jgi:hypothetical protein